MRQQREEASRTRKLRSHSKLDELLEVADDILIRRLGMTRVLLHHLLGIPHLVTDKELVIDRETFVGLVVREAGMKSNATNFGVD